MRLLTITFFIFSSILLPAAISGQKRTLTLSDAIEIAQAKSYSATVARLNLMSRYWSYRSYRAELLPSVNLTGGLMEFNRSMVETRNYEDGQIRYVENNTLSNNLMLSVDQNIAPLGGKVSLQSYLYRLDQFSYDNVLYNSRPIRLSYTQPLFSFNSLKWMKKTEPLRYELAKRTYLESIEDIGVTVVDLFFNVLSAQSDSKQARSNLADRKALFEIARKRFEIGTITKSELLQLELSVINGEFDVDNTRLAFDNRLFSLLSFLRLPSGLDVELIPPYSIPDAGLSTAEVIERASANSPQAMQRRLDVLQSEQSVAQAKGQRGIQLELYGEVGLSKTGYTLKNAYTNLQDNEIVGLRLSLPLFDWGVGKGRVKMAKADLEATLVRNRQLEEEYIQDMTSSVNSFNIHTAQCRSALRAQDIAVERYEITRRRFEAGTVTVTDLNTAWQEAENARTQYIRLLQSCWSTYYTLRRSTLYDWINGCDINADFDKLINSQK